MNKKAVVLISGGLDSATALAIAKDQGFDCYGLSFDYGQRHVCELTSARNVAKHAAVIEHKIIRLDLSQIGGSALTDPSIAVPNEPSNGIPVTYVPARNTIFLAIALGWAEVLCAQNLFIGVNAVDYSGYPDCRPEFIQAFEAMANLATKKGVQGERFSVHTPLIHMSKADIIKQGAELGVDYALTVSCYDPDERGYACGRCDSCRIRAQGFKEAGIPDPTHYQ
ncbi:7-cyano-7-deazaguanine synthase QueC [Kaarinaea lacus]